MNAVAAQLNPKRWTWRKWGLAVSVAVAAVLIFAYTPKPNLPELKAQGVTLAQAVQRYQADHGTFPKSLEDLGVASPESKWGGWQYVVTDTGIAILKLGDYYQDGFSLYWQSDTGWQTGE